MKKLILIAALLTFLFSCDNRFPDYKDLGGDVYMKLLSFGDSNKAFNENEFVKAEIFVNDGVELLYHNFSDNILANSNPFNYLFEHLNEGDSAVFYVGRDGFLGKVKELNFPKINQKYLTVTIKIHQYYSIDEYPSVKTDGEMLEQVILKKYLAMNGFDENNNKSGVYIRQKKRGNGEPVSKGDKVVINYKAYFTNCIEFDNTYKDIAFTFTYGNPDQVIRGLEIAIKGMKKDEESIVVIPSQLAFGDEGSSTGVVPPYSTVVYKLKIVKIE